MIIDASDVRGLVRAVMNQLCPYFQYDAIEVSPISDVRVRYWMRHDCHRVAEGHYYLTNEGSACFEVVEVHNITCPRREPVETNCYQALFENGHLIKLTYLLGENLIGIPLIELESQLL